jgi:hypothetical protein
VKCCLIVVLPTHLCPYMIHNGISYAPIQVPDATLADGSSIPTVGITRNMRMSIAQVEKMHVAKWPDIMSHNPT